MRKALYNKKRMHLNEKCILNFDNQKTLIVALSVTLLKAINTTSLFLEVHVTGVKRMVFRINFAAINAIFGIDGTSGFKLRTVAHHDRNFVVFWVNSFFHGINKFLCCLNSVGEYKIFIIYLQRLSLVEILIIIQIVHRSKHTAKHIRIRTSVIHILFAQHGVLMQRLDHKIH